MMDMKTIAVETFGVMRHLKIFSLLAGAQELTIY